METSFTVIKTRSLKNWVQGGLVEGQHCPGILCPPVACALGSFESVFLGDQEGKEFASEEEVGEPVIPSEASSRETDTPKPLWWPQQNR